MRTVKCIFILMAFCLLFAATPAAVSAGETVTQTADQPATEEEAADQAEEEVLTEKEAADQAEEEAVTEEEAAEQVEEEAVTKEKTDAPAQTEETAERNARSTLYHIPFVCLVMAIVLAGFILWGKNQEKKEAE